MSAASAIKAGAAYVEITTRDSKLIKGLKRNSLRLKEWGAAVTAAGAKLATLGAAGVAGFLGMGKMFADAGSELVDMSQRTGVSVEALSELGYAAEQSGASLATVETSVKKMQKKLADAAGGSKEAQETLAELGLSAEKLGTMTPDKQLEAFGDAINSITDPAKRTQMAIDIFGKAGTQLLPLFANGAKGMQALRQQARDLGLTWDTETAQGAEALGDQLDTVWKLFKKMGVEIGASLLPDLRSLSTWLTTLFSGTIKWIKANQSAALAVFRIAAGVMVAGAALVALGAILSGAGLAISGLVTIAGVFGTAVSAVGAALAFLLSPVGLVIAAVVGLATYFAYTSGAAMAAVNYIADSFGSLVGDVSAAWGAIGTAMASGDLGAAAGVAWAFIELEWTKGSGAITSTFSACIDALNDLWGDFRDYGSSVLIDMVAEFNKATSDMKAVFMTLTTQTAKALLSIEEMFGADRSREKRLLDTLQNNTALTNRAEVTSANEHQAGSQEQLDQMNAEDDRKRERDAAARKAAADKALADAQAAFDKALAVANGAPARAMIGKAPAPDLPTPDDLAGIATQKVGVAGTFNAAAISGLGSGSAQERTARAAEKTAENTGVIKKAMPGWGFT